MKKVTVFVLLAASLAAGAAGAVIVDSIASRRAKSAAFPSYNDGSSPVHFTAYTKEGFPDLTYAAENAVQAVVSVYSKMSVPMRSRGYGGGGMEWFFGIPQDQSREEQRYRIIDAGGSGVLISPDGYIVSNNHVIENSRELNVQLYDGRTFEAKLVGTDKDTDIALLKIDTKEDLPFLAFGNSDELRLGEWVLAIGSPMDLKSTVTAGIVSAKARGLSLGNQGLESFIQTDAAVNSGNSGGALVNTAGELVGINTIIKSETGSYVGYSFAIPSALVGRVVTDLKDYGVFQRPLLGISMNEINKALVDELGEKFGIKEPRSGEVIITELVEEGAAADAGVKAGDIISEVNGTKITSARQVQEMIFQLRPGDRINFEVIRDGKPKQFAIVLRNMEGTTAIVKRPPANEFYYIGSTFREVDRETLSKLGIEHGLQVSRINSGVLREARIREGYIVTHINDRPIRSFDDLKRFDESNVESFDGVYPDGKFVSYQLSRRNESPKVEVPEIEIPDIQLPDFRRRGRN